MRKAKVIHDFKYYVKIMADMGHNSESAEALRRLENDFNDYKDLVLEITRPVTSYGTLVKYEFIFNGKPYYIAPFMIRFID